MGIDFGTKRVGVALSNETNEFALPHSVIQNNTLLISQIQKICNEYSITDVVVGESKDYSGEDNSIMEHVRHFIKALKEEVLVVIHFEPEFLTSAHARRVNVRRVERNMDRTGVRPSRREGKDGVKNLMLDASAAALILKSFLDRKMNQE